jgi:hypothetical protein
MASAICIASASLLEPFPNSSDRDRGRTSRELATDLCKRLQTIAKARDLSIVDRLGVLLEMSVISFS